MTTATIKHNDTDFTVSFNGEANTAAPAWDATVGYPSVEDGGPDLSSGSSMGAYPTEEIEAFVSAQAGQPVRFADCTGSGADAGVWESWRFRPVSA
jgi:hypothetical protein